MSTELHPLPKDIATTSAEVKPTPEAALDKDLFERYTQFGGTIEVFKLLEPDRKGINTATILSGESPLLTFPALDLAQVMHNKEGLAAMRKDLTSLSQHPLVQRLYDKRLKSKIGEFEMLEHAARQGMEGEDEDKQRQMFTEGLRRYGYTSI